MGARATSKSIKDLLRHIDTNELVLPEIQREFVWSKSSVKLLFDSLYRGMPIGHMLVWKADRPVQPKQFAHKRLGKPAIERFYGYLLDGQQRLTAISLVREAADEYRLLFNLWQDDEHSYDLFYWYGNWAKGDLWQVPVSDVLSPDFQTLEYMKRLRNDDNWRDECEPRIHEMLERLRGLLDYEVAITEFETDDYREATELFIRFNSTGKKLNKNDLAVAELAWKVPGLVSRELSSALARWEPQFRFTKPFLVQCLAAVSTERMSWKKPKSVWDGIAPAKAREAWRETERALGEVLKLITGTVRWDSSSWIPSFNALIPLVVICSKRGPMDADERIIARRWLLLAGVHSLFSGSVYTQLDQILRKLGPRASVNVLWNRSKKRLRRLRPDDFQGSRISGAAMSLYISMLRNRNARDWKSHDPLDGTVLGQNANLNVHHFFPRALLNRHGHDQAEINTLSNYVVLSAGTNLYIGTEEPSTYLRRERVKPEDLEDQCIPSDPELWSVERYLDFLEERERLMAIRMNEFLGL